MKQMLTKFPFGGHNLKLVSIVIISYRDISNGMLSYRDISIVIISYRDISLVLIIIIIIIIFYFINPAREITMFSLCCYYYTHYTQAWITHTCSVPIHALNGDMSEWGDILWLYCIVRPLMIPTPITVSTVLE